MKTQRREFTKEDLSGYFIHDDENYFLKHNGKDHSYDVEEGIEGAQIFNKEELVQTIDFNESLGRKFDFTRVDALVDPSEYEIEEQIL